jgi:hypothetical protein
MFRVFTVEFLHAHRLDDQAYDDEDEEDHRPGEERGHYTETGCESDRRSPSAERVGGGVLSSAAPIHTSQAMTVAHGSGWYDGTTMRWHRSLQ